MTHWFADTYFWLAFLNPKDGGHARAAEWMDKVRAGIVTSEWVLLEVADAMSHPKNRAAAVDFIQALRDDPAVSIVGYDAEVATRGFALFAARLDKEWSLTDCISFAIMQRESITESLTGDHHFEQAGFVALLK